MKQQDALARYTLDTLPFNVAVIDDEGTILLTNRSWQEFGGAGPSEHSMVGLNYFENTDTEDDEHAETALEGIHSVIEGEQDLFKLEYPCHSPNEKRWFLMRATALPAESEGSVVVAHINITDRKLAEMRANERNQALEHLMARLHGLVGEVMESVLQARTREEIESTVAQKLAAVEPYRCAWVGRTDLGTEEIKPAVWAGGEGDRPDSVLSLADDDDPTVRAVNTDEPQIQEVTRVGNLGPVHGHALVRPGAIAAFPLTYNETRYGVLTVYTDRSDVFDEREFAVLEVLAGAVSTAVNAVEGKRILTTDTVVELELAINDDGIFYRDIAADLDAILTHEGTIPQTDGPLRMLFIVEGPAAETIRETATAHEQVDGVTVVSTDGDASVVEFEVSEPPVVAALADKGAETTAISAEGGDVRLTVEMPAGTDTRSVLSELKERYPATELLARREHERTEQTKQELVTDIEERLTDRQRHALRKAYLGGFFDWPRETSGEDLAQSMDISPSTYHQHLRTAERKVLSTLFEE